MSCDNSAYGPVPFALPLRECFESLAQLLSRGPLTPAEEHLATDAARKLKRRPGTPSSDRLIHEEAAVLAAEHRISTALQCSRLVAQVMGLHGPKKVDRFALGALAWGSIRQGKHISINIPLPTTPARASEWYDCCQTVQCCRGGVPTMAEGSIRARPKEREWEAA